MSVLSILIGTACTWNFKHISEFSSISEQFSGCISKSSDIHLAILLVEWTRLYVFSTFLLIFFDKALVVCGEVVVMILHAPSDRVKASSPSSTTEICRFRLLNLLLKVLLLHLFSCNVGIPCFSAGPLFVSWFKFLFVFARSVFGENWNFPVSVFSPLATRFVSVSTLIAINRILVI